MEKCQLSRDMFWVERVQVKVCGENQLQLWQVWDIQDQNCLLVLRPKCHHIQGDIQACHYSRLSKTLAIATEQMNALSMTLKYVLPALLITLWNKTSDMCYDAGHSACTRSSISKSSLLGYPAEPRVTPQKWLVKQIERSSSNRAVAVY